MEKNFKSKLNLDYDRKFVHEIKKDDLLRIAPSADTITNLNRGADIKFQILSNSNPLDICNAKLYYQIEITKAEENKEQILETNFFPNLFENIRLRIAGTDIEAVDHPGIYSTLLNLVFTDENYKNEIGQFSGWILDESKGEKANAGYNKRKEILNAESFEGYFELKYLLGFLQNYDRVLQNVYIQLTLTRKLSDSTIFFGDESAANKKGASLKLTTLELHIPELTLNPATELKLLERIRSNNSIIVSYLNRNCVSNISLGKGTNASIRLTTLSYRPRYVLIAFKNDVEGGYAKNNSLINLNKDDNNKIIGLQLQLNSTYYPINRMIFNSAKNQLVEPYFAYVNICRANKIKPQLSLLDWKRLYPIFCFDCSNQDDRLVINGVDVQIHITKDDNYEPKLFALILEEKQIEFKLSNSKISIVEPISANAPK